MNEPDKSKGARLRALRMEHGLTLREMSEASGYSDTQLHYIETGKRGVTDFMEATYMKSLPIARDKKHQKFVDRKVAA